MPAWRMAKGNRWLAAHGESLTAFNGRCIPGGCVAPHSNTPGILGRRALPAGRLARLGATPDFHHGLPGSVAESDSIRYFHRMKTLSVTDVARNFSAVLDAVERDLEEIVLVRNQRHVARLV